MRAICENRRHLSGRGALDFEGIDAEFRGLVVVVLVVCVCVLFVRCFWSDSGGWPVVAGVCGRDFGREEDGGCEDADDEPDEDARGEAWYECFPVDLALPCVRSGGGWFGLVLWLWCVVGHAGARGAVLAVLAELGGALEVVRLGGFVDAVVVCC